MQSSCQGRENALTCSFKRLHLTRLGRRFRQLVQASVTLQQGSLGCVSRVENCLTRTEHGSKQSVNEQLASLWQKWPHK